MYEVYSICLTPKVVEIQSQVFTMSNTANLFHWKITIFQHIWAHWFTCPLLAHSTITRKWKRLFENGCKRKSPISVAHKYRNSCQDGESVSRVLQDYAENNDTSAYKISYIQSGKYQFKFYDPGKLSYKKPFATCDKSYVYSDWMTHIPLSSAVGALSDRLVHEVLTKQENTEGRNCVCNQNNITSA